MPAIPDFKNIKELKNYLRKKEKQKVKHTKKEIEDAKAKLQIK
jgi:hypothetical protein